MDANTATLNLIQKCVGPDDNIKDMSALYDALVKALGDAHLEGEEEFSCRAHHKVKNLGDPLVLRFPDGPDVSRKCCDFF